MKRKFGSRGDGAINRYEILRSFIAEDDHTATLDEHGTMLVNSKIDRREGHLGRDRNTGFGNGMEIMVIATNKSSSDGNLSAVTERSCIFLGDSCHRRNYHQDVVICHTRQSGSERRTQSPMEVHLTHHLLVLDCCSPSEGLSSQRGMMWNTTAIPTDTALSGDQVTGDSHWTCPSTLRGKQMESIPIRNMGDGDVWTDHGWATRR